MNRIFQVWCSGIGTFHVPVALPEEFEHARIMALQLDVTPQDFDEQRGRQSFHVSNKNNAAGLKASAYRRRDVDEGLPEDPRRLPGLPGPVPGRSLIGGLPGGWGSTPFPNPLFPEPAMANAGIALKLTITGTI